MCLYFIVLCFMEIYVIRHTPVAVDQNTCYGQTDVAVAANFLEEVSKIDQKIPTDFDAIYSSPLRRCHALASELNRGKITSDPALMEMHFGDWESKTWDAINPEKLQVWMDDFVNVQTPNGESLSMLFARVKNFIDQLRTREHNKVLIVTHAGVIRCLWAYLLGIPLQNIFKIPVGYGEVFSFYLDKTAITDRITRKE